MMSNSESPVETNGLEIAIIGMSCRFPGADNAEAFWRNLSHGIETISSFSDKELEAAGIDPVLLSNPNYVRAKGALGDIDLFDAAFFGISPREAEIIDPQHRFFLECAWESLEDAGYDPENYSGPIGVYAGGDKNLYLFNILSTTSLAESVGGRRIVIGNDKDYLATRVSYKLNLRGPSVSIQTSCSTSLVAVHLACRALLGGECDMALAGGVSIGVSQKAGYLYEDGEVASPDGHCRAFDAEAQGTVDGDGIGIVVLKRLADAVADGDSIEAVIKGSAINNDGSLKVSYTAPSVEGQAKAIRAAQIMAEFDPATITYVEAHGTGTALGDPIEIEALTQAFGEATVKKQFCAIGSVKTNIGHLDTAAGIAGLIKTVLALKHRMIPPSLHFKVPNPKIDFENTPFYVNAVLSEWKAGKTPRRAGISSFGIGGTNAHVILEEAPRALPSGPFRRHQLLVLSARTDSALEKQTSNLIQHLQNNPEVNFADVAYTLQIGRRAFNYRRMLVCRDLQDALDAFESQDARRVQTRTVESGAKPVAFMFPGQGAQRVNMGRDLYNAEPQFRKQVDFCSEFLIPHLGLDLRDLLYPRDDMIELAERQLDQTSITQPAIFVISYSLARLLRSWGVHPEAMIGHSIGEYVAATLSEVISLEDALSLVAARGQLMQSLPGGSMLAIELSEEQARQRTGAYLSIAAINGPSSCVVSGPIEAVENLEIQLQEEGVACRRLRTSHAFHSHMVDPVVEPFIERIRTVKLNSPRIPFVSNITGTWITEQEATAPDYWARQIRQAVRFSSGVSQLLHGGYILLEVGPGQVLSALVKRQKGEFRDPVVIPSLPGARVDQPDDLRLLNAIGQLWLAGARSDWNSFHSRHRRRRIHLPTYPFERQRYWVGLSQSTMLKPESDSHGFATSEKKRPDIADWFYVPVWKQSCASRAPVPENRLEPLCWLVFVDECGIGSRIIERLKGRGEQVMTVAAGGRFCEVDEGFYEIDPREPEHYEQLLRAIQRSGRAVQRIVHMLSVTVEEGDVCEIDDLKSHQDSGFFSLLFLAKALGEQIIVQALGNDSKADAIEMVIISNDMQEVTGDEPLCPEKATLLGPCKVIPQETPKVTCRSIDISLPELGTRREEELIDNLVLELTTGRTDQIIAYRGRHRWIQSFERVGIESGSGFPARLREQGVYLITGGLGGISLEIAKYLGREARAKLVLVGRSHFPSREEWPHLLAEASHKIREKIMRVQELEQSGAEVMIESADVADLQAMRVVAGRIKERFGAVNGVIHAAGLPPGTLIQRKTPEIAASVLAPKVTGTRVLEALFKDEPLDFFMLFSSIRSLTGGPGAIDYCAANTFLDAFARYHSRNGGPTISVNWEGWRDIGMAVNTSGQSASPDEGMTCEEGLEVFSHVLDSGFPQIVVSIEELEERIGREKVYTASMALEDLKKATRSKSVHPRPRLGNPYVPPGNEVEKILSEIWQQLLGIDSVGIQDNFFELGGDSVISIQIIARANQSGVRITPKQVFECQTIEELAAVADTAQAIRAEQGPITGPVQLTPIQRRFFEREFIFPDHYNQAFMFEAKEAISPGSLFKVIERLLIHHDALRFSFIRGADSWQQLSENFDGEVAFTQTDLSEVPDDLIVPFIEAMAADLQSSLSLSQGSMLRVAMFDPGHGRSSRILIIAHHLVTDALSWRTLLGDMQVALNQLSRGEKIDLPPKTTSLKEWADRLIAHADSEAIRGESDYWLTEAREQVEQIPRDFPSGINTLASAESLLLMLSEEQTAALLYEVPKVYNTQINDVLLTALAQAYRLWTGRDLLLLDLEGHGREALFEDVDLSRTVGWFTTIFPVLIDLRETSEPGDALKSVKEQLRSIPNRGMGYGLLRYLSGDEKIKERLKALPQPELSFLYLGQLDQVMTVEWSFSPASEAIGPTQNPKDMRSHLLQINGSVIGGRLQIEWTYSKDIHRRTTIERLAQGFQASLETIIARCLSGEAEGYTPSDFPFVKLSQKELDDLIVEIRESAGD
ncbi:MAG: condensation domain-containing protein [Blastocatellia bacterium]|nr:condensation domain-containing protein [Blastocatellia bacterium]